MGLKESTIICAHIHKRPAAPKQMGHNGESHATQTQESDSSWSVLFLNRLWLNSKPVSRRLRDQRLRKSALLINALPLIGLICTKTQSCMNDSSMFYSGSRARWQLHNVFSVETWEVLIFSSAFPQGNECTPPKRPHTHDNSLPFVYAHFFAKCKKKISALVALKFFCLFSEVQQKQPIFMFLFRQKKLASYVWGTGWCNMHFLQTEEAGSFGGCKGAVISETLSTQREEKKAAALQIY